MASLLVLRLPAIELVAELTDQFPFGPGQALVVRVDYQHTLGLPAGTLDVLGLTALAAVAAFSAVGSILTIAMLICPAATARLLTDDLRVQIRLSLLFATLAAALGTLAAGYGPPLLGAGFTVSASGTIATLSGLGLALAATLSPRRHGHAPKA